MKPEQAAKTVETSQIPEVLDESLQVVDETLQVLLFLPYSWFTLEASILPTPVFFFFTTVAFFYLPHLPQDANKTLETSCDALKSSQASVGSVKGGKGGAAKKDVASKTPPGPKMSRSNRSGLQFPVGR